jgi:hypothetical protein
VTVTIPPETVYRPAVRFPASLNHHFFGAVVLQRYLYDFGDGREQAIKIAEPNSANFY